MLIRVRKAAQPELVYCLEIRREVFIDEQRVPPDRELDDLDAKCVHFLALYGDEPVGTGRLRDYGPGTAKIERVAVRHNWRKRGVGAALVSALESWACQRGRRELVLSAQLDALPFYESLGYRTRGPEFLDAGIPHRHMHKRMRTGRTRRRTPQATVSTAPRP